MVGMASRDRWGQIEATNLIALELCLKMSTNTTAQKGHLLDPGVRPRLLCSAFLLGELQPSPTVSSRTEFEGLLRDVLWAPLRHHLS